MATRLPIVLLAAVAAFAAAPAAAQVEEMSFAGSGAETTFSSSDVIAGRTVDTEVKLFVSAADGAGAADDRASRPFVAVAVTQTDKATGTTIFDGLRYSNDIDFNLRPGLASALLKVELKVKSGSDSRMVKLDVAWTVLKDVEELSQTNKDAEEGNVKDEKHTAKVRSARSSGVVTVTYPGADGKVLTLKPSDDVNAIWHTKSSGKRVAKLKRNKREKNRFTEQLSFDRREPGGDSFSQPGITLAAFAASTGYWTGFWTWNVVQRVWFWTWVWTNTSGQGWIAS